MNDGYLNRGDEHWFYCWQHKKRWLFGSGWFGPIKYKGDDTISAEEALILRSGPYANDLAGLEGDLYARHQSPRCGRGD
jgi:hypothetical protein